MVSDVLMQYLLDRVCCGGRENDDDEKDDDDGFRAEVHVLPNERQLWGQARASLSSRIIAVVHCTTALHCSQPMQVMAHHPPCLILACREMALRCVALDALGTDALALHHTVHHHTNWSLAALG